MAILTADKAEAVANARLQALEEALREDLHLNLPDIPDQADRIKSWLHAHQTTPTAMPRKVPPHHSIDAQGRQHQRTTRDICSHKPINCVGISQAEPTEMSPRRFQW